MTEESGFDYR